MANEISLIRSLSVVSGNYRDGVQSVTVTFDLLAIEKFENIIPLTTAETDIVFTNVTTPKFCMLRNLDATNIIQWGPKSAGAMIEVGRISTLGEVIFEIGSGVTIRCKTVASTANLLARCYG